MYILIKILHPQTAVGHKITFGLSVRQYCQVHAQKLENPPK